MSLLETLPEEYLNVGGAGRGESPPVFVFTSSIFMILQGFNKARLTFFSFRYQISVFSHGQVILTL